MSTHNLCFELKYEKYQKFYLKTFRVFFFVAKFSIYLNRHDGPIVLRFMSVFIALKDHSVKNLFIGSIRSDNSCSYKQWQRMVQTEINTFTNYHKFSGILRFTTQTLKLQCHKTYFWTRVPDDD